MDHNVTTFEILKKRSRTFFLSRLLRFIYLTSKDTNFPWIFPKNWSLKIGPRKLVHENWSTKIGARKLVPENWSLKIDHWKLVPKNLSQRRSQKLVPKKVPRIWSQEIGPKKLAPKNGPPKKISPKQIQSPLSLRPSNPSLWPPCPFVPPSLQPPCPCWPLVPAAPSSLRRLVPVVPLSLWPPRPFDSLVPVAPPSLCPPPPPPASATPLMYVWMSKEFSCLWMLGTSTKPLWSRGMISASQARGPGFDPPLRKVFQLSDFYFCWGWDWHRSRWSNLLFPSREENRAVRKTALFPSQLWGKYSPHSIKDSVGNEIWCDQTCRCCWTMSGKIKKMSFLKT